MALSRMVIDWFRIRKTDVFLSACDGMTVDAVDVLLRHTLRADDAAPLANMYIVS